LGQVFGLVALFPKKLGRIDANLKILFPKKSGQYDSIYFFIQ